jgi:asparagine synthase (glutamine-hydrolysing)
MNKVRFLVAFPLDNANSPGVDLLSCAAPGDILGASPRIWIAGDAPIHSLGTGGRVIGYVFEKDTCRPPKSLVFGDKQSARTAFRQILETLWGAYFAICYDATLKCWAVMPDPSGLLPVYRWQTMTHVLLSSDPALFDLPGLKRPQPDWSRVPAFLARPELRERRTCLEDVAELRPGAMQLPAMSERPEALLWQPGAFLPTGEPVTFERSAQALRERLAGVMDAWANAFSEPLVAVSGGVDSSLICAALGLGGHRFGCVTIATADPSGDERAYARELAAHFDVRLAEHVYDPAIFDPYLSASAGQPRPNRRLFTTAVDEGLIDGADSLGANIVFDGNGGDNLFCYLHSAAPVVDRWRSGAGWRATAETLIDMCHVTGCDIPTMVRASIRRRLSRACVAWPADNNLLCAHVSELDACEPLTPWLTEGIETASGKHDHLALIMKAQNHLHGLGTGPPRFSPLMSQPILELCIALPTWIWTQGGINRALARQAFAPELPQAILARTSKAGPDSFVRRIFDYHRGSLRELLLDGLLAANKVLDRDAVERAFEVDTSRPGATVYRLLDIAEAENWARSWI